MTINTVPTEALNASIVEVKLNSAQMFGMQYSLECFSKRTLTDEDGNPIVATGLIHTELLQVTGPKWRDWTPDAAGSDEAYIAGLALTQLGLEAAPVEEAAPAEEPAAE
ncbi:MAG: hypothetical protein HOF72_10615 [Planctomycetaceae bacterium]|nr:hypothetical protein [Planctomycetaceae bacterium]